VTEQTQSRPFRDYFDSEYLTGDALAADGTTFTIADKSRTTVENKKGEAEHKLVLTFTNGSKWLTNITNCSFMTHMFRSNAPADWVGKRVTLQFDPTVKFGKDVVGGIRVIGSPELTEPVKFMFAANSRQKPRQVTLKPTGTTTPATVDPVTGEVDDADFGFADDAPHAEGAVSSTQRPQISDAVDEGGPYASAEEDAEDGDIPGRGPKSAQGELA